MSLLEPFTEAHVKHYDEQGYVILHDFLPEEKRAAVAEGLRSCIPPWESLKDDPPQNRSAMHTFPFPTLALNRFFAEPALIAFVRRLLGTHDIVYRPGYSIARYPGELVGSKQGWHIDNGNNSLLPESDDRTYGQVVVWYFPEAVRAEQGALQIIPKPFNDDTDHRIVLDVPANTVAIFHNYVWHSGSDYTADDGQRYSHAGMFGRIDHHWEGFRHMTNVGWHADFRAFVGTLDADQRQVFYFPPPGHPYYTKKTLALLDDQYPGWNARGEYTPADG